MGPFQWQMSWPRHVPATWSPFFGGPRRPLLSPRSRRNESGKPPKKKGALRVVRAARARPTSRRFLSSVLSFRPCLFFFSLLSSRRDAPAALVIQRISHRRCGVTASPLLRALFARRFETLHGLLLIRKTPLSNAHYKPRSED